MDLSFISPKHIDVFNTSSYFSVGTKSVTLEWNGKYPLKIESELYKAFNVPLVDINLNSVTDVVFHIDNENTIWLQYSKTFSINILMEPLVVIASLHSACIVFGKLSSEDMGIEY